MAKIVTFTDDFATSDTGKWTFQAGVGAVDGQLVVPATTSFVGAYSAATWDLTSSSCTLEIVQAPRTGTAGTYFVLEASAGNDVRFIIETGTISARYKVANVETVQASAAFDLVAHRWWRISESAGTITWSTSRDGLTWTTFTTWAMAGAWSAAAVQVQISAGQDGGVTTPDLAADNLNLPPDTSRATTTLTGTTGTVVSTAAAATTISPSYPSLTLAAGETGAYYAVLHVRGAGRVVATPAGWSVVGSFASTNTSAEAAGVGPTRTWVFKRTSTSALAGSASFTISAQATSGVAQGWIRAYQASGTGLRFEELLAGWSDPATGTGAGSTAPNGSLTVAAGNLAAGDSLDICLGIADDDNTAASIGSITCTGATIGAAAATAARTTTANGNQMTTAGFVAAVSAGPNTGTALSVPVTQSPANQMHALVLRVRATVPATPAQVTGVTATGQPGGVHVSWTTAAGATSYTVRRDGMVLEPTQTITGLGYTDTSGTAGVSYGYTVAGVNTGGAGAESASASAAPQARPDVLSRWRSAVTGRAGAPAKWLGMGESLQEGQGASTEAQAWFAKALASLRTSYPTAGVAGGRNFLPARRRVYGPDSTWINGYTSSSGTLTMIDVDGYGTLGHKTISMAAGATMTFTVSGTAVDIVGIGGPGGPSFTYAVDGGSATSVSQNLGAYDAYVLTRVTFGARGSHTVLITASGAGVLIAGLIVYDQDETAGVHGYDSGWTAATIAQPFLVDLGAGGWPDTLNQLGPDLVTIELAGNDVGNGTALATFKTNARALLNILQGLTKVPSIIWVIPYMFAAGQLNAEKWADYREQILDLQRDDGFSWGTVDLFTLMPQVDSAEAVAAGIYINDFIHPNDTGHTVLAGHVVDALVPAAPAGVLRLPIRITQVP